jgi:hypothetical protein
MPKPMIRGVTVIPAAIAIVTLGICLWVTRSPEGTADKEVVSVTPKEETAARVVQPSHPIAPRVSAPPAAPQEAPKAGELSEQELLQKNEEDRKKQRFEGFAESLEQRLERAQERKELLVRWDKETQDQSWTREVSSHIEGLLGNAKFSSDHLKEVDCRETVCRFQLRTSNNTQGEVMSLIQVARELGEETWLRAEPQDNEPQSQIEVFYPRDGYRLSGGGGRIAEPPRVAPDLVGEPAQPTSPEHG